MAKKVNSNSITIFSWNVNGIRAIQNKGFMDWFKNHGGDIICLQETKAQPEQINDSVKNLNGFTSHWFSAEKKGYSSVAVYTRIEPLKIIKGFDNPYFDNEGRVILTEYDKFVLANVYFPNGGRGPERVSYKLDFYDELFFYLEKNYRERKGIIITGDFNTAHKEIDLAEPEKNRTHSGFLPEEREWIDKIINLGYVDVFRKFNTKPDQYTYWDQVTRKRERNLGWRIDYFMVSKDIADKVKSAKHYPEVMGSDHCPISIEIDL
ncbi:MAG: exodeoxyribonuclease III [Ignavibacteria bacterium]|nr:exodeoxyribonuclease III [Ignavibacteria bacterium]